VSNRRIFIARGLALHEIYHSEKLNPCLAGAIMTQLRARAFKTLAAWALLLTMCVGPAFAQSGRGDYTGIANRSRALSGDESSAQRTAEDTVSLSADTILGLLQKEPGLLLQAKRLLVRKAYEQGRLLAPQDLDDDALFRLIREDANVRVLITHEIEDRRYIRAKPSRDELEHGLVLEPRPRTEKGASQGAEVAQASNQEDAFWSRHERTLEHNPEPEQYRDQPAGAPPAYNPEQRSPEERPSSDARRQVQSARTQPPPDELFEGLPGDALAMPRVRPQEMPNLLAASLNENSSGVPGRPELPGGGYSADMNRPLSALSRSVPDSSLDVTNNRSQSPRDNRSRPAFRPSWTPGDVREAIADQHGLRHRPNPYADVPSLYDLYSQYSGKPAQLERFGLEALRAGTGNVDDLPMDMPVGPEYVLGPGDGLSIDLWGSVSQRMQRVVDRQGRVALPEVGAIEVSGRSLGEAQHLVQSVLRSQFRDVEADVSLSRLRTVRVYVVGDVERAGAYDVSSLSTPLNAVHEAGGPTGRGSLRTIRHYRGKQLLQEVDVYDLFLHGIHSDLKGLQAGDTILVPPLGPEVTVEGMVRRPAIYELGGEKNLAEVLELAGGVLQSGTLRHVDVERVEAHLSRSMLRLDIPEDNKQEAVNQALEDFKVQDGDKIKISPILPYADKTVYLEGHVFRPGKFAYREGMKVTDIIKSYTDLLPEPYQRHAEIIRLNAPDYQPVVLAFNLSDALAGKESDLPLKPFDTIRIFGRFDFEDPPVITVTGAVRDPGDHVTNGVTYLRDVVYLAGGTTADAQLNDAQVFRKTQDGKLKVLSVNLSRALAGDDKNNILLEAKDRIFIHRSPAKVDPPIVKIEGEVERPGKYPLGEGMTAADLVRVAGGFRRGAYTELADLTRYEVEHGANLVGERETVAIGKALAAEPDTDVRLHDGDVLTIRQLSGWNDVGATITVKGEVAHPGTYGIQSGERLSSIIARAGGFQPDAYPYGAIFSREQVREIEERNRAELIRQVQDEGTPLKLINSADADEKAAKEASLMQWKSTLEHLQNSPPLGRLVIHISSNVKWANTPADIQVRAGDVIYLPKKPTFIMVDGSVYNSTAVTYKPGKSAGWYLRQAGGPNNTANKKAIFVIRADGSVAGGSGGMFTGGVLDTALRPGDMVVVPEKAYSGTTRWKSILQTAQLATAVGIAVQVAKSF
jgi:protein involved in polysaccharide export with SLBB domain